MRKLIKAFAIIMLVSFSFAGCRTKYIPVEIKITDSISIHDTTFNEKLIPYRDSVSVKDTSSFLSNPYAYSWAVWDNGILHHSLGIWPNSVLVVRVPYYMERIKRIEIPKPYPVEKIIYVDKELNWWQSVFMWSGKIAWLVFIFWIIYRTNKCFGWITWIFKKIV